MQAQVNKLLVVLALLVVAVPAVLAAVPTLTDESAVMVTKHNLCSRFDDIHILCNFFPEGAKLVDAVYIRDPEDTYDQYEIRLPDIPDEACMTINNITFICNYFPESAKEGGRRKYRLFGDDVDIIRLPYSEYDELLTCDE
ncbi:hypothetical protein BGZ76_004269 [Entomortierella beljakovae]|nr:hypothetical protein BGZ76_004269 [Entomortierella beljakovae]